MKIKVDSCCECPFNQRVDYDDHCSIVGKFIYNCEGQGTPNFCPLMKGEITISHTESIPSMMKDEEG